MNRLKITILSKENCTFCEHAKTIVNRLMTEYPLSVEIVDLNTPEGQSLAHHAGFLFPPGIFIDDKPFSYGRLSERKLRREIEREID